MDTHQQQGGRPNRPSGKMPDEPSTDTGACVRCGVRGRETLVTSRVAKMTGAGHFNVFRCEVCGTMAYKDVPQEPPK